MRLCRASPTIYRQKGFIMTTRELIKKMPAKIVAKLDSLRKDYKNPTLNKDAVRKEIAGYTTGLRDAGMITESERQKLFIYGVC